METKYERKIKIKEKLINNGTIKKKQTKERNKGRNKQMDEDSVRKEEWEK